MEKMIRISGETLFDIMYMLLGAAGLAPEHCRQVAENLLQADLRGVNTHGIMRLSLYLKRIAAGAVNVRPVMKVLEERKAVAVLDGDFSLGQISGRLAMEMAIKKAADYGVGMVSVIHSQHIGAGAYYVTMAKEQDMIGIALTNTPALMAPWGGKQAMVGNNPYAVCIPAGEEYPVLLDMAFSQVALGKIMLALAKGEKIPEGWAQDKAGKPTEDPQSAMDGLLLPAGGYKGYGQAVIVDLLAGLLPGAAFSAGVVSMAKEPGTPQNSGQMYIAVDISAFRCLEAFKRDMDEYIRAMRNSPKADGVADIFLPGEQSWRRMEESLREGICFPQTVLTEAAVAGDLFGVDIRPLIDKKIVK